MTTDHEKIEQLHQADVTASKNQDFATLRTLLSDDAVVLPPGGQLIRGRDAIDKGFERMIAAPRATEVMEYGFDWKEVEVCGEFAFEWGYILGKERDLKTGAISSQKYQAMRILQKQTDGTWKVHRTIWNEPAT